MDWAWKWVKFCLKVWVWHLLSQVLVFFFFLEVEYIHCLIELLRIAFTFYNTKLKNLRCKLDHLSPGRQRYLYIQFRIANWS